MYYINDYYYTNDYNSASVNSITKVKTLISNIDTQIDQLNYTKDCYIDRLVSSIRNLTVFPWSQEVKFYESINAYLNRKQNPLPKTKAERKEKYGVYDPKVCYDMAFGNLKELFPTIKAITSIVFVGWNTNGINIHFTRTDNDTEYFFYVPIIKNIGRRDIKREDSTFIDYNIGAFKLYKQTSKCSCELIWQGYDTDDAKNFFEKESEKNK